MTDVVEFFHNPQSRGRIARWMLEEAGAPYEVRLIDFRSGAHKAPDYLALNPMGKVPAIRHRGAVVTECAAIGAYLAEVYPQAGLAPPPLERARYYRWMFFSAGALEYALTDKMLGRPPASRPQALGYGALEDTLRTLETALTPGPWLLGETFSVADVLVGSQLGFASMQKALDLTPTLAAYLARCQARPAFQRAAALDAELAKAGAVP